MPRPTALRDLLKSQADAANIVVALPALMLVAYWLAGEPALVALGLGLPGFAVIRALHARISLREGDTRERRNDRTRTVAALDDLMNRASRADSHTAAILMGFDPAALPEGACLRDRAMSRVAARLAECLRDGDEVMRLDTTTFCISLSPVKRLDLPGMLRVAARLQNALATPPATPEDAPALSACLGMATDRDLDHVTGRAMLDGALIALDHARRAGPSSVRTYAPGLHPPDSIPLVDDLERALARSEMRPWYQPQLSCDTGCVTGVEVLARWHHPERGILPPGDFLPQLQAAGRLDRLGDMMLTQALTDLRRWDAAGLDVPRIGLNFTAQELRDPRLADRIAFTLDLFGMSPHRLCVEVLESVVTTSPDDVIAHTIGRLSTLGCRIDLDDFGTGQASISSLRGAHVDRLKIDRSYVTGVDRHPKRQRLVSAILLMADRLGLDTLAEGVETPGEHSMLAQLGCGHVQGFVLARAMPTEQCADWLAMHAATVPAPPRIGRTSG